MYKRIATLMALMGLALAGGLSRAQDDKTKDPVSKHGLTLKLRKATEGVFTKETKSHGLEVFLDANNKYGIYLSETGSISGITADLFQAGEGKVKDPEWRHAMWLNARKAGERDWDKGKKYGIEVFRDENNGNLIYVNENVQISVVPAKYSSDSGKKGDKPKNPAWRYSFDFPVRKAGEKDQDKARKIGVEVFKDENNGNLIYIAENGNISVVPGKLVKSGEKEKGPESKHGLTMSVRPATEKGWDKAKPFGIEVYVDENNGNLIYITEAGELTVVSPKSE